LVAIYLCTVQVIVQQVVQAVCCVCCSHAAAVAIKDTCICQLAADANAPAAAGNCSCLVGISSRVQAGQGVTVLHVRLATLGLQNVTAAAAGLRRQLHGTEHPSPTNLLTWHSSDALESASMQAMCLQVR
jgi:hypothetical protein